MDEKQKKQTEFGLSIASLGIQILVFWMAARHIFQSNPPTFPYCVLIATFMIYCAGVAAELFWGDVAAPRRGLAARQPDDAASMLAKIKRIWREKLSGKNEEAIFLVMFLFIISAAMLTGFSASIINGGMTHDNPSDPLQLLENVALHCAVINPFHLFHLEFDDEYAKWIDRQGWSPQTGHGFLMVIICILARLILNVGSLCSILPHAIGSILPSGRIRYGNAALNDCRWLLSGVVAGAVSGLLLYWFTVVWIYPGNQRVALSILGAPVVMLIFTCGEVFALAILSDLEPPRVWEWLAALAGKVLLASVAWMTLFSLVLLAPAALHDVDKWLLYLPASTWLAVSAWAARTAFSSTAIGDRPSVRDLLIKLGPPVFLIGLFFYVSYLVSQVLLLISGGTDAHYAKLLELSRTGVLICDSHGSLIPTVVLTILLGLVLVLAVASRLTRPASPVKPDLSGNLLHQYLSELLICFACITILVATWVALGMFKLGFPMPLAWLLASGTAVVVFGRFIDINLFSLQEMYANRLVRCYLGASRPQVEMDGHTAAARASRPPFKSNDVPRTPDLLTGFDEFDDIPLAWLAKGTNIADPARRRKLPRKYTGPIHLFCTALNQVHGTELAWQERLAEPFLLSPLWAGSESTGYRRVGVQGAQNLTYGGGVTLGQAAALSGAAVSPNMGYYSSPAVTALLTVFNLRLGAWLGNPSAESSWYGSGPRMGWLHLLKEALGFTDAAKKYVYISDGGHFDNLGAYELIRRRCRVVICSDAGADPKHGLHELGMLVRKVRIDFGIRIDIDTRKLHLDARGFSRTHVAVGIIRYGDRHKFQDSDNPAPPKSSAEFLKRGYGILIYIKPSFTGDEPADILDYRTTYPAFPHQSTVDQFFSESQFESYRALGSHIIKSVFEDSLADNEDLFDACFDVWRKFEPVFVDGFIQDYLQQNQGFINVQQALRTDPNLHELAKELESLGTSEGPVRSSRRTATRTMAQAVAERQIFVQMFTVLEDAYFALGLDGKNRQSTTSGWLHVVDVWLASAAFDGAWKSIEYDFSPEFGRFINERSQNRR